MSQAWNASQYINHASFVAEHGSPVLDLLNPKLGERILDLGCGDGALTQDIEQMGASVHGVDSSESMIEAAQKRGLSAEVMSGDSLSFHNEFDAVFSNAALHWMINEESVLSGVSNALKPNGRFVGEFGGQGNVGALVNAMTKVFESHAEFGEFVNPWYFPSVEEYKQKLQDHGFHIHYIELIPRPTPLESGIGEWLKIFSNGITKNLNPKQNDQFLNEVEYLVKPHLFIEGQWVADYVRLRFSAQKV
ncbi:class I SAM-dependent methyltransferase [Pseudoalteromonas sp.]|uniref:class I SAM-dependent methyltransferase n=1 Tax=Pseudoalteromonas sp. TaxID=53249 RepID=UPI003001F362